jgi:hypothetical protein
LRLPAVPCQTGNQHNGKDPAKNLAAAMRLAAEAFFGAAGRLGIAAGLFFCFVVARHFAAAAAVLFGFVCH